MNKKHLFGTMTLALALGFALVSCDKSKTQSTESEETSAKPNAKARVIVPKRGYCWFK